MTDFRQRFDRALIRKVEGLPLPPREYARIGASIDPPRVRHTWREAGRDALLPWPSIVILDPAPDGAFLYRFANDGAFAGDTWHADISDARNEAEDEYRESLGAWQALPNDLESIEDFVAREASEFPPGSDAAATDNA